MSVDYYVAVHQANWPTAAAVQTCLIERDYPVRLEKAASEPLSSNGLLAVRFRDRAITLEAGTVQLGPTQSYAYRLEQPDDVFAPADINADLAGLGVPDVTFGTGDYVLSLSFRSSTDETRAGLYLMAAMIHCFGGYGFEFQAGEHGGREYAESLVADAADNAQWVRPSRPPDDLPPATRRALDEFLAFIRKSADQ